MHDEVGIVLATREFFDNLHSLLLFVQRTGELPKHGSVNAPRINTPSRRLQGGKSPCPLCDHLHFRFGEHLSMVLDSSLTPEPTPPTLLR